MDQQNKISGFEEAMLLGICLLFDAFDLLLTPLDAIFGLGEVLKFINNIVASFIIWIWATIRGIRQFWLWAGSFGEMLPLANAFPSRTITMAIAIRLERKIAAQNVLA